MKVGIFSKTVDSAIIEVAGRSGLDFVIIDMEHGPVSISRVHDHVRALALTPAQSLVRVASLEASLIGSALDSGADGVLVPNIQNADQARRAVQAARFHPIGQRGVCRFVRAADFGETPAGDYFDQANCRILACQIEGRTAVDQLDEILTVEGIDVLFIGPYDLSQSLGCPGEIAAPKVLDSVTEIVEKAQARGVQLAAFSDQPELTRLLRQRGVRMIACSVDMEVFRRGVQSLLSELDDG